MIKTKQMTISLAAILAGLVFSSAAPADQQGALPQASFDCAKASAPVEKLICSDTALAALDREMAMLFTAGRQALDGEAERLSHLQEQRAWLKARLATCQIPVSGELRGDIGAMRSCLVDETRKRSVALSLAVKASGPEVGFVAAPFDSALAAKDKELKIARITPAGDDVEKREQIVVQFNRPVVPIGRMNREASEIPVDISPPANCHWQWLNTSALACNLDEADYLALATRYTVQVKPGITDETGATTKETTTHEFVTARPRVLSSKLLDAPPAPRGWAGPGLPLLNVRFNQQVTQGSVAASLFIEAKGERYPVEVAPSPYYEKNDAVLLVSLDKRGYWVKGSHQVNDQPVAVGDKAEEARLNWVVSPGKALPEDTEYTLKVTPGLVSALGQERGVEDRVVVQGATFPPFQFLGISCLGNDEKEVFIAFDSKEGKCSSIERVNLDFSVPLHGEQMISASTISPPLHNKNSSQDPMAELKNAGHRDYLVINHQRGDHYRIPLPNVLKVNTEYTVALHGAAGKNTDSTAFVKDVFGRGLPTDVNATLVMDCYRPLLQWSGEASVLEKDMTSEVAFYATSLEKAALEGEVLTAQGERQRIIQEIPLPGTPEQLGRSTFGVRKLFGGGSGIFKGKIQVRPETARFFGDGGLHIGNDFLAQVTPFHVHAKVGTDSTLVWVTDLQSGQPVSDAETTLIKGPLFAKEANAETNLATAKTNAEGVALLPGSWGLVDSVGYGVDMSVLVRKGEDIAYLPFEYDFHLYRRMKGDSRPIKAWGMTAEGVYKSGTAVDYKIYVRTMRTEGAALPTIKDFTLEIHDPKGSVVEKRDISLSDFGTYTGTFTTGKDSVTGHYKVYLISKKPYVFLSPLDFLVSDYVSAPFSVQTTLNKPVYESGEDVTVDTVATLHSGGPFTDADNHYRATLYAEPFTSSYPTTEKFSFGSPWCRPLTGCGKVSLLNQEVLLSQEGKAQTTFTANEDIGVGTLKVESAVEDDRGKRVAAMATARYFGVDRFVGLRTDSFMVTAGKPAKVHFVVTDRKGKPVKGVKVTLSSYNDQHTAFRAKGPGSTYITRLNAEEVKNSQNSEEVISKDGVGVLFWRFQAASGGASLIARIEDSKGRGHATELKFMVTGQEVTPWGGTNKAELDFVLEKNSYHVGETADIILKNPYPKAKALVTIERMGIIKSWVEDLNSSVPQISFPVTEEMVPNFSLSVVVFSPRVETRQTDDTFDLGKPEWRMGYAQMEAIGTKHSLDFAVQTNAKDYRPGQEVRASVRVRPRDGASTGPLELAVAVLDTAVFDLVKGGMTYFDPQQGFYSASGDGVLNYNILQKLVTHAPTKKGDDPGGDGGLGGKLRADMKSLAFWNPALLTDDQGQASFTFNAPDNLTGWRVLVLAADKKDHLGVGYSDFKVNRPTEIQPAMPNQVVEGDTFAAVFTVMNRTTDRRKIKVDITASGTLADSKAQTSEVVEVGPFERKPVTLRLVAGKVPVERDIERGLITFSVAAGDESDRDRVSHQLAVHKKSHLDVGANYGTTSEARVEEPLLFPDTIRPDAGDVTVTVSPTLIGDLEGAFRFMRDYPYACWEQDLTRAVMAAHYQGLKKFLASDFAWDNGGDIIHKVLAGAKDFQAANGGMAFFKPDNERVDPYLSAFTALGFTMLEKLGHKPPQAVEDKLLAYLKELLRTDIMPSYYSKGMASSVRAVALAALARHGQADEDMLKRHAEHISQMDLFGKAHMLEAAIRVGRQEATVEAISNAILGSSNETGGRIVFNETLDDGYNRMLSSAPRTNCAVLSSLLLLGDSAKGAEKLGDIPFRLARTIRGMRGQRDHFENSQENLFCMNGLLDYASRYEKVEPAMEVAVQFDGKALGASRFASFKDAPLIALRPLDATDPGQRKVVTIEKTGAGRLYYATVMRYAPLSDQEKTVNAGMQVDREYFVEDRKSGAWRRLAREDRVRRGDVVRVDLYLRLPASRTQVVVDDPIPGGLEPVNTELATASQVDADKAEGHYSDGSLWLQFSDWREYSYSRWSFNHQELRLHAARFFADYLPPGNYHLSYAAQAVAAGDFTTQPVFAGEMYDADVYGKGVSGTLHVDP